MFDSHALCSTVKLCVRQSCFVFDSHALCSTVMLCGVTMLLRCLVCVMFRFLASSSMIVSGSHVLFVRVMCLMLFFCSFGFTFHFGLMYRKARVLVSNDVRCKMYVCKVLKGLKGKNVSVFHSDGLRGASHNNPLPTLPFSHPTSPHSPQKWK